MDFGREAQMLALCIHVVFINIIVFLLGEVDQTKIFPLLTAVQDVLPGADSIGPDDPNLYPGIPVCFESQLSRFQSIVGISESMCPAPMIAHDQSPLETALNLIPAPRKDYVTPMYGYEELILCLAYALMYIYKWLTKPVKKSVDSKGTAIDSYYLIEWHAGYLAWLPQDERIFAGVVDEYNEYSIVDDDGYPNIRNKEVQAGFGDLDIGGLRILSDEECGNYPLNV